MKAAELQIYLAGMPVILLYNFESAIFRSCGNTQTPLVALVISGVLNVGSDDRRIASHRRHSLLTRKLPYYRQIRRIEQLLQNPCYRKRYRILQENNILILNCFFKCLECPKLQVKIKCSIIFVLNTVNRVENSALTGNLDSVIKGYRKEGIYYEKPHGYDKSRKGGILWGSEA